MKARLTFNCFAPRHNIFGHRLAHIVFVANAFGQHHRRMRDFLIGHLRQQVMNAIEPSLFLVVSLHHPPRRLKNVGALQHDFLGLGVFLPAAARLQVHRAEFPLLERIMDAAQKAQVLLFIGDGKPVLDDLDARADQHSFKIRHSAEKLFVLSIGAKAHHPLDPGAVVPAAVKQHDFTGGGQVRHITLKVPLRAFAVTRCRQRRHAANPWIEPLGDALDDTALAGGVAAFKQNDHLVA